VPCIICIVLWLVSDIKTAFNDCRGFSVFRGTHMASDPLIIKIRTENVFFLPNYSSVSIWLYKPMSESRKLFLLYVLQNICSANLKYIYTFIIRILKLFYLILNCRYYNIILLLNGLAGGRHIFL
jgi:hypothetical protein